MITRTIYTTTIEADKVEVANGVPTTEHVSITRTGNVKNENTAFKALCKELGIGAYVNITINKAGQEYVMSEETFLKYAKVVNAKAEEE